MKERAKRLPLIIAMIDETIVPLKILAWHLEVSMRTIHRDIKIIRGLGHRIDSSRGHGGGVVLRRRRRAA